MGLIKEPKNVDFSTQSEPWTEPELAEFRALMQQLKAARAGAPPAKAPRRPVPLPKTRVTSS